MAKNVAARQRQWFMKQKQTIRKNICGAVTTPHGKPIEIIRGQAGKNTCTKKDGKCPNCNVVSP